MRNNTLIAVAAGHFVANRDLALLGDIDPDQAIDAMLEVIVIFAGEDLDVDDNTGFAVRDTD